jgi:hypothetical protein
VQQPFAFAATRQSSASSVASHGGGSYGGGAVPVAPAPSLANSQHSHFAPFQQQQQQYQYQQQQGVFYDATLALPMTARELSRHSMCDEDDDACYEGEEEGDYADPGEDDDLPFALMQ